MLVAFVVDSPFFGGDVLPLADVGVAAFSFCCACGGVVGRASGILTGGKTAPGDEMRGSRIAPDRSACCAICACSAIILACKAAVDEA